jgi:hypothetical protein
VFDFLSLDEILDDADDIDLGRKFLSFLALTVLGRPFVFTPRNMGVMKLVFNFLSLGCL